MSRIIAFPYYLHDNYNTAELFEHLEDYAFDDGVDITEEDVQRLGRPFYEISLSCAADLDTGEVYLLACQGQELKEPVRLN